jgi:hypothetical protein
MKSSYYTDDFFDDNTNSLVELRPKIGPKMEVGFLQSKEYVKDTGLPNILDVVLGGATPKFNNNPMIDQEFYSFAQRHQKAKEAPIIPDSEKNGKQLNDNTVSPQSISIMKKF